MSSDEDLKAVKRLTDPDAPAVLKRKYKTVTIQIPLNEWKRFKELCPMQGAATWFCQVALSHFIREMHDTPEEALDRSVRILMHDLNNERRNMDRIARRENREILERKLRRRQ